MTHASLATYTAADDLDTLLFPVEYTFCFQTVSGKKEVVFIDSPTSGNNNSLVGLTGQPCHLKSDKAFNLPIFSTKDIRVVNSLLNQGYIAHVIAGGKEMCSKAGDTKGEDAAQRELDCLWKITTSSYSSDLRVPKLLGLIKTPNNNNIVGFLEEYIPVSEDWELSTLGNIDNISMIHETRRRRWVMQIQETVQLLHQIGIVWGDGKASNVLIHRETDDAWIIDFGGGWTEGWVDEDLSGTIQGGEVAVKKIMEYLQV